MLIHVHDQGGNDREKRVFTLAPVCHTPGQQIHSLSGSKICLPSLSVMATRSHIYAAPRRAGFTLIELLAVILLVITVLGMGVPAMFAAERKSYVNKAMNELIRVHRMCMSLQRELAARGDAGIVTLKIETPPAPDGPTVTVEVNPTSSLDWEKRFGQTFPISINSDSFISSVTTNPSDLSSPPISWNYEAQTGFIVGGAKTLTFRALPSGSTFKVQRTLKLFPLGQSDVP